MRSVIQGTSLFFKIILATSLILIVAISFNVWWNTSLHEASIERLTLEKTKIIAEFIERNVVQAMERGRHFDMHRILKNYATYREIRRILLLRPDGTVKASTQDQDLNLRIEDMDSFLKNQYFVREETVRLGGGNTEKERVFYFNNPIANRPECYQCHGQKDGIIGVLIVSHSLKGMDEMISKIEVHSIILAILTIGFLSTVLGFFFFRFINLPITRLTKTMRRAEDGDLSVRVNIKRKDEMGRLAENLNTMIEKLHLAKEEAEQYHEELIQRADRMASIGELASGIAHEIRNPLAGIQGAIQILAEGFPEDDARRGVTDEIQKQIYKLERLVKNLLNYAKPVPTNYLATDMNQLVDKMLSFFMTQRGKPENVKVEKKFFSPLPKIMLDPNSMEQAFLNLILNARKAMPKGGTLTISTHALLARRDDSKDVQEVQIIFEDTGIGIAGENLHKIFNPFFSTRSDGTGLGLSITRNIIEDTAEG
jgi:signal transduction histidine kinase